MSLEYVQLYHEFIAHVHLIDSSLTYEQGF